jgi:hypothetical protein
MGSLVVAVKISYSGLGEGKGKVIDLIEDLMSVLKSYRDHGFVFDVELIMDGAVEDLTVLGKAVLLAGLIKRSEDLEKKSNLD